MISTFPLCCPAKGFSTTCTSMFTIRSLTIEYLLRPKRGFDSRRRPVKRPCGAHIWLSHRLASLVAEASITFNCSGGHQHHLEYYPSLVRRPSNFPRFHCWLRKGLHYQLWTFHNIHTYIYIYVYTYIYIYIYI